MKHSYLGGARKPGLALWSAGRWLPIFTGAALLLLLLLLSNSVALWLAAARPYTIDAGGYGDQLLLHGFYAQEQNAAGDTYRWTGRDSRLQIEGAALSRSMMLQLTIGGTPADAPQPLPLTLDVNGAGWGPFAVTPTPRRYHLLVPATANNGLRVGFASPLTNSAADPRPVGLRLDAIELRLLRGLLLPPLSHLLAQALCVGLLALVVRPLRLPGRFVLAVLVLAAVLLGALEAAALPLMNLYLPRLVGIGLALMALAWLGMAGSRSLLRGIAALEVRWLWGVALLAAALRMVAMLYPPFATHDVGLNLRRLEAVGRGTLVLVAGSAEFASARTIYPPAPYVALLPSYLLLQNRELVLFFGLALLDGTTALLVGLLAHRLGLGKLTARLAALLYCFSGLSFTALWWGFTAQVFGQWCTVPVALGLLAAFERPALRPWLAAALFFQVALLSHAGVAVLAVVWVTLVLALYALLARPALRWWRNATIFYVSSGIAAIVLLYGSVLLLMLGETQRAGGAVSGDLWRGATGLFVQGMLRAYSPPGLPLVPAGAVSLLVVLVGLGLLLRQLWPRVAAWAVVVAWLATTLLFVSVDLALGLIVRHFYFALPLACVAGALALATLARRARWLQPVVWAATGVYCVAGLVLWLLATAEYVKPSMTPLTH